MAGSPSRRSRIESLIENDIFIEELNKIKLLDDSEYSIHLRTLQQKWGLGWEYLETLEEYLKSGEFKLELGDKDIRIIDYRNKRVRYPKRDSESTEEHDASERDEFSIMQALEATRENGVYLKIPGDVTMTELKDFISRNGRMIKQAQKDNHPKRSHNQYPELISKTKVKIFKRWQSGESIPSIAKDYRGDQTRVRQIIDEIKKKISD